MKPDATGTRSLTVPEASLLEHLLRGAPDAETAVRLGLPIGEAKARIRALLERLQLNSRAELTTWDGVVPAIVEPDPEPAEAAPIVEVAPAAVVEPFRRRYARLLPLAACGLLVAGAGAFVLTASEGRSAQRGRSAVVRTIDQLAAPSAYIDGVPLPELRIGSTTVLPHDLALVQWDTGTGVIRRIYRSEDGAVRTEELFAPARGETVSQVAATPDGRELVVAVNAPQPGGRSPTSTVYRSSDGGATWSVIGASREGAFVTAVGPAGVAIALDAADGSRRVELLPGGATVRGTAQLTDAGVVWRVLGTAIQQTANPALTRYTSSAPFVDGARYAVRLRAPGTGGATGVGVADDQGKLASGFTGDVRAVINVIPGGLIAADLSVPNSGWDGETGDPTFVLIDPTAGVAHPIETGAAIARRGQIFTVAVQRGPLVHIAGADGGCAPVRNRPVIDGAVIFCAPNGMALRPGETRVHNDYTWLRVMSGRERPGWVDQAYVTP